MFLPRLVSRLVSRTGVMRLGLNCTFPYYCHRKGGSQNHT